jgi:hypothetical protein
MTRIVAVRTPTACGTAVSIRTEGQPRLGNSMTVLEGLRDDKAHYTETVKEMHKKLRAAVKAGRGHYYWGATGDDGVFDEAVIIACEDGAVYIGVEISSAAR